MYDEYELSNNAMELTVSLPHAAQGRSGSRLVFKHSNVATSSTFRSTKSGMIPSYPLNHSWHSSLVCRRQRDKPAVTLSSSLARGGAGLCRSGGCGMIAAGATGSGGSAGIGSPA